MVLCPKSIDALIHALRSGIFEAISKLETLPKTLLNTMDESRDTRKAFGNMILWVIPLLASRRVLETLRQMTIEAPESTWAKPGESGGVNGR